MNTIVKILQVFNQYRFRGGEEAWVDAIPNLLGDSAIVEELRFSSNEWVGAGKPPLFKQALLIGDNPKSRSALRKHVERFKPDILLFHNVIPVGSLGLYFEAKRLGIPVLQYTHNFRPFSPSGTLWTGKEMTDAALHGNPWTEILTGSWQDSRIKTAILAWHLQRARHRGLLDCIDHWLAISEFMRDQFVDAGIPDNRISVLRHCWELPPHPSPSPEESHYLYLGRMVQEKGIRSLIEAWKHLINELGKDCPKLVIAGSGPMDNEILGIAATYPQIEHVGFVEGDVKTRLIHSCKAVMIPSICWESLGLTVYEAYAHGKPVIASRVGALKETVHEGQTGWNHLPELPQEIAKAVIDAEKAGAMGRIQRGTAGFKWLKANADPVEWKNRMLSLCQTAAHQRKTFKA